MVKYSSRTNSRNIDLRELSSEHLLYQLKLADEEGLLEMDYSKPPVVVAGGDLLSDSSTNCQFVFTIQRLHRAFARYRPKQLSR